MKTAQPEKVQIRKSDKRGHANHGWLDSYHTFSFADYYDSKYMGFRSLRVINEDRVNPGQGFGTHPHREMEIISFVIKGSLEHKDSMGNGSVIHAGNIQHMTAGTGITHSEFNPSNEENVYFLQIWIEPNQHGLQPSYQEVKVDKAQNVLKLLGSMDGRKESILIHQDVLLYYGCLEGGQSIEYQTQLDRGIWIQMIDGEIEVSGQELKQGDGISLEKIQDVSIKGTRTAQFLLFDLK